MHLTRQQTTRCLGFAALTIVSATASKAIAADIPPLFGGPLPVSAVAAASWAGPYLGVSLGGRWTNSTWTTTCLQPATSNCSPPQATFPGRLGTDNPALFEASALRLGGYLGYNWQIGNWVVGVEGDLAWADGTATRAGIPGTWRRSLGPGQDIATVRDTWDASLRGRVGMLIEPDKLVYATGGLAWLSMTASASCEATYPVGWCIARNARSVTQVLPGWTVGAGVEWRITPSVILRGEYRYSAYQRFEQTFFHNPRVDAFRFDVSPETHTASVGISYLFGEAAN
jgi:outer membrane immunogenic protein